MQFGFGNLASDWTLLNRCLDIYPYPSLINTITILISFQASATTWSTYYFTAANGEFVSGGLLTFANTFDYQIYCGKFLGSLTSNVIFGGEIYSLDNVELSSNYSLLYNNYFENIEPQYILGNDRHITNGGFNYNYDNFLTTITESSTNKTMSNITGLTQYFSLDTSNFLITYQENPNFEPQITGGNIMNQSSFSIAVNSIGSQNISVPFAQEFSSNTYQNLSLITDPIILSLNNEAIPTSIVQISNYQFVAGGLNLEIAPMEFEAPGQYLISFDVVSSNYSQNGTIYDWRSYLNLNIFGIQILYQMCSQGTFNCTFSVPMATTAPIQFSIDEEYLTLSTSSGFATVTYQITNNGNPLASTASSIFSISIKEVGTNYFYIQTQNPHDVGTWTCVLTATQEQYQVSQTLVFNIYSIESSLPIFDSSPAIPYSMNYIVGQGSQLIYKNISFVDYKTPNIINITCNSISNYYCGSDSYATINGTGVNVDPSQLTISMNISNNSQPLVAPSVTYTLEQTYYNSDGYSTIQINLILASVNIYSLTINPQVLPSITYSPTKINQNISYNLTVFTPTPSFFNMTLLNYSATLYQDPGLTQLANTNAENNQLSVSSNRDGTFTISYNPSQICILTDLYIAFNAATTATTTAIPASVSQQIIFDVPTQNLKALTGKSYSVGQVPLTLNMGTFSFGQPSNYTIYNSNTNTTFLAGTDTTTGYASISTYDSSSGLLSIYTDANAKGTGVQGGIYIGSSLTTPSCTVYKRTNVLPLTVNPTTISPSAPTTLTQTFSILQSENIPITSFNTASGYLLNIAMNYSYNNGPAVQMSSNSSVLSFSPSITKDSKTMMTMASNDNDNIGSYVVGVTAWYADNETTSYSFNVNLVNTVVTASFIGTPPYIYYNGSSSPLNIPFSASMTPIANSTSNIGYTAYYRYASPTNPYIAMTETTPIQYNSSNIFIPAGTTYLQLLAGTYDIQLIAEPTLQTGSEPVSTIINTQLYIPQLNYTAPIGGVKSSTMYIISNTSATMDFGNFTLFGSAGNSIQYSISVFYPNNYTLIPTPSWVTFSSLGNQIVSINPSNNSQIQSLGNSNPCELYTQITASVPALNLVTNSSIQNFNIYMTNLTIPTNPFTTTGTYFSYRLGDPTLTLTASSFSHLSPDGVTNLTLPKGLNYEFELFQNVSSVLESVSSQTMTQQRSNFSFFNEGTDSNFISGIHNLSLGIYIYDYIQKERNPTNEIYVPFTLQVFDMLSMPTTQIEESILITAQQHKKTFPISLNDYISTDSTDERSTLQYQYYVTSTHPYTSLPFIFDPPMYAFQNSANQFTQTTLQNLSITFNYSHNANLYPNTFNFSFIGSFAQEPASTYNTSQFIAFNQSIQYIAAVQPAYIYVNTPLAANTAVNYQAWDGPILFNPNSTYNISLNTYTRYNFTVSPPQSDLYPFIQLANSSNLQFSINASNAVDVGNFTVSIIAYVKEDNTVFDNSQTFALNIAEETFSYLPDNTEYTLNICGAPTQTQTQALAMSINQYSFSEYNILNSSVIFQGFPNGTLASSNFASEIFSYINGTYYSNLTLSSTDYNLSGSYIVERQVYNMFSPTKFNQTINVQTNLVMNTSSFYPNQTYLQYFIRQPIVAAPVQFTYGSNKCNCPNTALTQTTNSKFFTYNQELFQIEAYSTSFTDINSTSVNFTVTLECQINDQLLTYEVQYEIFQLAYITPPTSFNIGTIYQYTDGITGYLPSLFVVSPPSYQSNLTLTMAQGELENGQLVNSDTPYWWFNMTTLNQQATPLQYNILAPESPSDYGEYQITLSGLFDNITYNFWDCNLTLTLSPILVLLPDIEATFLYTVYFSGVKQYQIPPFTIFPSQEDISVQETLTYTAKWASYKGLPAPYSDLPLIMEFNPNTLTFTIYSDAVGDVGTYVIDVIATTTTGEQNILPVTIIVDEVIIITPPSIFGLQYQVFTQAQTFEFYNSTFSTIYGDQSAPVVPTFHFSTTFYRENVLIENLPSCFTAIDFSATPFSINVHSINNSDVGTYYVQVTAELNDEHTYNNSFTTQISIKEASIIPPIAPVFTPSTLIYQVFTSAVIIQIAPYTVYPCCNIESYFIQVSQLNPLFGQFQSMTTKPDFVEFTSSTQLTIQSSSNKDVGQYQVTIIVQLPDGTKDSSQVFYFTIAPATISSSFIGPEIHSLYVFGNTLQITKSNLFTVSPSSEQTSLTLTPFYLTISTKNIIAQNPLPNFMTFSGCQSSFTIIANALTNSLASQYEIQVVATLPDGTPFSSVIFQINVVYAVLTGPSQIQTQIYTIYSSPLRIPLSAFTSTQAIVPQRTSIILTPSYQEVTSQGAFPIDPIQNGFIKFDSSNDQTSVFTVYSRNNMLAGSVYYVTVTASLIDGTSSSLTFQLNLQAGTQTAQPPIFDRRSPFIYQVFQNTQNIDVIIIQDPSDTSTLSISAQWTSHGTLIPLAQLSTIPNNAITFSSSSMQIIVSTSLSSSVGNYDIVISASDSFGYNWQSTYEIEIIAPQIFTPPLLSSQALPLYYIIQTEAITFNFNSYSTYPLSVPLTYSILQDGIAVQTQPNIYSPFSFDPSTLTLTIQSNLNALAQTYSLIIEAALADGTNNQVNTITVFITPTQLSSPISTTTPSSLVYTIIQGPMTFSLNGATSMPAQLPISYNYNTLNQFPWFGGCIASGNNYICTIQSTSLTDVGQYDWIPIYAYFTNDPTIQVTYYFNIQINAYSLPQPIASFINVNPSVHVDQGVQTFAIILPTLTTPAQAQSSVVYSMNCGSNVLTATSTPFAFDPTNPSQYTITSTKNSQVGNHILTLSVSLGTMSYTSQVTVVIKAAVLSSTTLTASTTIFNHPFSTNYYELISAVPTQALQVTTYSISIISFSSSVTDDTTIPSYIIDATSVPFAFDTSNIANGVITFSIIGTQLSQSGQYTLQITKTLPDSTTFTDTYNVDILPDTITPPCTLFEGTSSTSLTYVMYSAGVSFTVNDYSTNADPTIATLSYDVQVYSSNAWVELPSDEPFSFSNMVFQISSTNPQYYQSGTQFRVVASLSDGTQDTSMQFTVSIIPPTITSVTGIYIGYLTPTNYYIYSTPILIQFGSYSFVSPQPTITIPISYVITVNGQPLPSSGSPFAFNQNSNVFEIFTSNIAQAGTYTIGVQGAIADGSTSGSPLTFTVVINPPSISGFTMSYYVIGPAVSLPLSYFKSSLGTAILTQQLAGSSVVTVSANPNGTPFSLSENTMVLQTNRNFQAGTYTMILYDTKLTNQVAEFTIIILEVIMTNQPSQTIYSIDYTVGDSTYILSNIPTNAYTTIPIDQPLSFALVDTTTDLTTTVPSFIQYSSTNGVGQLEVYLDYNINGLETVVYESVLQVQIYQLIDYKTPLFQNLFFVVTITPYVQQFWQNTTTSTFYSQANFTNNTVQYPIYCNTTSLLQGNLPPVSFESCIQLLKPSGYQLLSCALNNYLMMDTSSQDYPIPSGGNTISLQVNGQNSQCTYQTGFNVCQQQSQFTCDLATPPLSPQTQLISAFYPLSCIENTTVSCIAQPVQIQNNHIVTQTVAQSPMDTFGLYNYLNIFSSLTTKPSYTNGILYCNSSIDARMFQLDGGFPYNHTYSREYCSDYIQQQNSKVWYQDEFCNRSINGYAQVCNVYIQNGQYSNPPIPGTHSVCQQITNNNCTQYSAIGALPTCVNTTQTQCTNLATDNNHNCTYHSQVQCLNDGVNPLQCSNIQNNQCYDNQKLSIIFCNQSQSQQCNTPFYSTKSICNNNTLTTCNNFNPLQPQCEISVSQNCINYDLLKQTCSNSQSSSCNYIQGVQYQTCNSKLIEFCFNSPTDPYFGIICDSYEISECDNLGESIIQTSQSLSYTCPNQLYSINPWATDVSSCPSLTNNTNLININMPTNQLHCVDQTFTNCINNIALPAPFNYQCVTTSGLFCDNFQPLQTSSTLNVKSNCTVLQNTFSGNQTCFTNSTSMTFNPNITNPLYCNTSDVKTCSNLGTIITNTPYCNEVFSTICSNEHASDLQLTYTQLSNNLVTAGVGALNNYSIIESSIYSNRQNIELPYYPCQQSLTQNCQTLQGVTNCAINTISLDCYTFAYHSQLCNTTNIKWAFDANSDGKIHNVYTSTSNICTNNIYWSNFTQPGIASCNTTNQTICYQYNNNAFNCNQTTNTQCSDYNAITPQCNSLSLSLITQDANVTSLNDETVTTTTSCNYNYQIYTTNMVQTVDLKMDGFINSAIYNQSSCDNKGNCSIAVTQYTYNQAHPSWWMNCSSPNNTINYGINKNIVRTSTVICSNMQQSMMPNCSTITTSKISNSSYIVSGKQVNFTFGAALSNTTCSDPTTLGWPTICNRTELNITTLYQGKQYSNDSVLQYCQNYGPNDVIYTQYTNNIINSFSLNKTAFNTTYSLNYAMQVNGQNIGQIQGKATYQSTKLDIGGQKGPNANYYNSVKIVSTNCIPSEQYINGKITLIYDCQLQNISLIGFTSGGLILYGQQNDITYGCHYIGQILYCNTSQYQQLSTTQMPNQAQWSNQSSLSISDNEQGSYQILNTQVMNMQNINGTAIGFSNYTQLISYLMNNFQLQMTCYNNQTQIQFFDVASQQLFSQNQISYCGIGKCLYQNNTQANVCNTTTTVTWPSGTVIYPNGLTNTMYSCSINSPYELDTTIAGPYNLQTKTATYQQTNSTFILTNTNNPTATQYCFNTYEYIDVVGPENPLSEIRIKDCSPNYSIFYNLNSNLLIYVAQDLYADVLNITDLLNTYNYFDTTGAIYNQINYYQGIVYQINNTLQSTLVSNETCTATPYNLVTYCNLKNTTSSYVYPAIGAFDCNSTTTQTCVTTIQGQRVYDIVNFNWSTNAFQLCNSQEVQTCSNAVQTNLSSTFQQTLNGFVDLFGNGNFLPSITQTTQTINRIRGSSLIINSLTKTNSVVKYGVQTCIQNISLYQHDFNSDGVYEYVNSIQTVCNDTTTSPLVCIESDLEKSCLGSNCNLTTNKTCMKYQGLRMCNNQQNESCDLTGQCSLNTNDLCINLPTNTSKIVYPLQCNTTYVSHTLDGFTPFITNSSSCNNDTQRTAQSNYTDIQQCATATVQILPGYNDINNTLLTYPEVVVFCNSTEFRDYRSGNSSNHQLCDYQFTTTCNVLEGNSWCTTQNQRNCDDRGSIIPKNCTTFIQNSNITQPINGFNSFITLTQESTTCLLPGFTGLPTYCNTTYLINCNLPNYTANTQTCLQQNITYCDNGMELQYNTIDQAFYVQQSESNGLIIDTIMQQNISISVMNLSVPISLTTQSIQSYDYGSKGFYSLQDSLILDYNYNITQSAFELNYYTLQTTTSVPNALDPSIYICNQTQSQICTQDIATPLVCQSFTTKRCSNSDITKQYAQLSCNYYELDSQVYLTLFNTTSYSVCIDQSPAFNGNPIQCNYQSQGHHVVVWTGATYYTLSQNSTCDNLIQGSGQQLILGTSSIFGSASNYTGSQCYSKLNCNITISDSFDSLNSKGNYVQGTSTVSCTCNPSNTNTMNPALNTLSSALGISTSSIYQVQSVQSGSTLSQIDQVTQSGFDQSMYSSTVGITNNKVLNQCNAFVSQFINDCENGPMTYTSSDNGKCPNGDAASDCTYNTFTCVFCFVDMETADVMIRVQAYGLPNHVTYPTSAYQTQYYDFQLLYNRLENAAIVTSIESFSANTQYNAQVCNFDWTVQTQSISILESYNFQQNTAPAVLSSPSLAGIVGFSINGIPIANGLGDANSYDFLYPYDPSLNANQLQGFAVEVDSCAGGFTINGIYKYFAASYCPQLAPNVQVQLCSSNHTCVTDKSQYFASQYLELGILNETSIGVALDGRRILGPYKSASQNLWQACDVDICNGLTLSTGEYVYVTTFFFPYTVGCWGPGNKGLNVLAGCSGNTQQCSQSSAPTSASQLLFAISSIILMISAFMAF